MELLGLVLVWPLILLIVGFVFISSTAASVWMTLLAFIFFFGIVFGMQSAGRPAGPMSTEEQLTKIREGAVAFSLALLLPIFVKYMLDASGTNLPAMILGLVIGFGALVWGMFEKGNKVITYANCIGGGLTVVYLYFELWSLGQLAQIVATAFGLVVAIAISIIKFRDKLS